MQQRHRLQRNLFEEDRRTFHIPGAEGPPLREDVLQSQEVLRELRVNGRSGGHRDNGSCREQKQHHCVNDHDGSEEGNHSQIGDVVEVTFITSAAHGLTSGARCAGESREDQWEPCC